MTPTAREQLPPAQSSAPGYHQLGATTWNVVRTQLGLHGPDAALNIASLALDRHVGAGRADAVAVRCLGSDGATRTVTYGELLELVCRMSHVLEDLGVGPGDVVASCLGRQLEQYVTCLGALRIGAVFAPLTPSSAPGPLHERLGQCRARVLVTTPLLHRRKVEQLRVVLPDLRHVLVTGAGPASLASASVGLDTALAAHPDDHRVTPSSDEDPALFLFTSGTTGRPKGTVHVHGAVVGHVQTARVALDLREEDVLWCTADPSWVCGTSYGIVAPLVLGASVVTYAGDHDAARWYEILADERVAVWYTQPTALRVLRRAGVELARRHDLRALRHVASVGELLDPDVLRWSREALGRPVHDTWWQTETGAIMVSNFAGMPIRAGSMGRPFPGVTATVLELGPDGRAAVGGSAREAPPGVTGELALRPGWPSMFRAYLDDPARYAATFSDEWYLSGDLARVDEDGYFYFVGRADDAITSGGRLIGPCEVESVLLQHPAVAEAGVVGLPDPVEGEAVRAYVVLGRDGDDGDDGDDGRLVSDVVGFARRRLGASAPREVVVVDHLPHTSSGQVVRRVLRARALGLAEGDLFTVEHPW